jgi:DNA-binding LytR/AlgR family response regulator
MEDDLSGHPMVVRCHRAFLVNLAQVERIVSKSGSMQLVINYSKDYIPVSRSNIAHIKETVIGKV